MRLKCLKNACTILVIAGITGIGGWMVSCDSPIGNPFSNNLGPKVPIEPPTLTLTSHSTGSFVRGGAAVIEGKATAYRALGDVKVRFYKSVQVGPNYTEQPILTNDGVPFLFDYVSLTALPGGTLTGDDPTEKDFTFTFDTTQLPDGPLVVQFRVSDSEWPAVDGIGCSLIVKNRPSRIRLSIPDESHLYTSDGSGNYTGVITVPAANSGAEVFTGTKIVGEIFDPRGVKPGYPKIQFWGGSLGPDPGPNGPWMRLFLSNPEHDDLNNWTYSPDNLNNKRYSGSYTFHFKLSQFTRVADSLYPGPNNQIIQYASPLVDLPTGDYHFRIKTSDTYWDEVKYLPDGTENPTFMRPCAPPAGETELVIHEPPNSALDDSGKLYNATYHTIKLKIVGSEPTRIVLDNGDIAPAELQTTPHIYMTNDLSEKIVVSAAERPNPSGTPANLNPPIFRLRVNAYHSSGVQSATLEWSHPTKGSGFLLWDNTVDPTNTVSPPFGYGYVTDTDDLSRATGGHKGADNPNGAGKIFKFTGLNGNQPYTKSGAIQNDQLFTSYASEYTLTVTTYLTTGDTSDISMTKQSFTIKLDESGAAVAINDIKGKSEGPAGAAGAASKGGTINYNAYTVNDTIQVSQYSHSTSGIRPEVRSYTGYTNPPTVTTNPVPVIKWFVEVADTPSFNGDKYLPGGQTLTPAFIANSAAADTEFDTKTNTAKNNLLAKLQSFRSDPASDSARQFMNFFKSEANPATDPLAAALGITVAKRGWAEGEYIRLSVDTRITTSAVEKTGTNNWNHKYLWLYVIAQDNLYNLGYTVQKLYVDDTGDKPVVTLGGLNEGITTANDLYAAQVNGIPQKQNDNVLGRGQGIELTLADDDGMRAANSGTDRIITITLTCDQLGVTNAEVLFSELFGSTARTEWNGELTQGILARALVTALKAKAGGQTIVDNIYGTGAYTWLPDGIYKLDIEVNDAISQKVNFTGYPFNAANPENEPNQGRTTKTVFFAVRDKDPEITIADLGDGDTAFLKGGARTITGSVSSRLKIQRLDITFDPDIISSPPKASAGSAISLQLYSDQLCTTLVTDWKARAPEKTNGEPNGDYIYYWKLDNVDFGVTHPDFIAPSTDRRFDVQAWDGIGIKALQDKTVQVDNTPPRVVLSAFNFGREDYAPADTSGEWNRVNGKVPIEVEVEDANGVGTDASENPSIRWFIVPNVLNAVVPVWDTPAPANGSRGDFKAENHRGGARYRAIVDTGTGPNRPNGLNLTEGGTHAGEYLLYVLAKDKAGNVSNFDVTPPATPIFPVKFKVVQSTDDPRVDEAEMYPEEGTTIGGAGATLKITGSVFDDDGFDTALADSYADIRFPVSYNPTTGAPLSWGAADQGWIPISGVINPITGNLDYEYDYSVNKPAYLSFDSRKYYQLRIRDEAERAGIPDALGNYNPEGKNPDRYNGMGVEVAYENKTIAAKQITSATYTFTLKDSDPEIFFSQYDPTVGHPNYTTDRPVFGGTNGKANLLAALSGTIKDISLNPAGATFKFGTVSEQVALTTTDSTNYTWNITNIAWLAPYDTAADGVNSITIEASDTNGNVTQVEWSFNRDTKGPDIDFDNIHHSTVKVVYEPSNKNEVYITGRLTDDYSTIGATIDYRFDNAAWENNYDIVANGGEINGSNATWSVRINAGGAYDGAFPDGEHTFSIRARDQWNNPSGEPDVNYTDVKFIVDRKEPQMITKGDGETAATRMKIASSLAGVPSSGYLPANQRVFSASGVTQTDTAIVFTLSGLVYEHNLDELRTAIRNGTASPPTGSERSRTLTGINNSAIAWKNPAVTGTTDEWFFGRNAADTADLTALQTTLRVRRAKDGDFGLSGPNVDTYRNRYVWELDVRKNDFYELISLSNNDGAERNVAVTARDLAKYDSDRETWPFYLDANAPKIEFTNINIPLNSVIRLEDLGDITLKGTVSDSTPVQKIEYKIEKKNNYALADTVDTSWTVMTHDPIDGDYKLYTGTGVGTEMRVALNLIDTTAITGDGKYRVTIKAYDWSLSASVGNESTLSATFWVDRNDPALQWGDNPEDPPHPYGDPLQNFYKWVYNTGNSRWEIPFDFTVEDANTFDPLVSGKLCDVNTTTEVAGTTTALTIHSPNADSSKVDVVVWTAGAANTPPSIQGKRTLVLTIKDKSGRTASFNQTVTFTIDNTAPTIAINTIPPSAITEAIVGRVEFRGSFTKAAGLSPVKRVAYAISTGAAPVVPTSLSDSDLKTSGWFFQDNTSASPYKLRVNPDGTLNNDPTATGAGISDLMEINDGLVNATLLLYDTRRFNSVKNTHAASTLLGNTVTANSTLTFSSINDGSGNKIAGNTVYDDTNVNQLQIYLLAIDEAGNYQVTPFEYWVYPAGDKPRVTAITNPADNVIEELRLLNGTIKLQGTAEDNYRVSKVWFRVLKDGYTGPAYGGIIPAGYEPAALSGQTAFTLDGYGNTWYRTDDTSDANFVPRKSVTWYAQINSNGELEPAGGSGKRRIIVQTVAEDTIWDDSLNSGNGGYTMGNTASPPAYTTGNYFSSTLKLKEVAAWVVSGAPTFSGEQVRSAASGSADTANPWGPIISAAVKGRSAYQVTVKHTAALGSIRWTNAPAAAGVSATANLLDGAVLGSVAGAAGIEAKAEPKDTPKTGSVAFKANTKYLILTPLGTLPAGTTDTVPPVAFASTHNLKDMVFISTSAQTVNIGAGRVMEAVDGSFEWLVTVDMDTSKLGFTGNDAAGYYNINLEAHDNSKSVALFSRKTAQIPVDALAPKGVYTQTTNVVGSSAQFGGEAGDQEAAVMGLARVVLWFSRNIPGTGERSIVWNERKAGANTTFNNHTGTAPTEITNIDRLEPGQTSKLPTGVTLPNIPDAGLTPFTSNNSCIVIDRQDPLGNQGHHGHQLSMGWASTGGALDTSWYAVLDSTLITSGRVTAHYIVYDSAGNGTYYSQKLMILNGVARIESITLATDMYGQYSPLNLQNMNGAWTNNNNLTFGATGATGGVTAGSGVIELIRNRHNTVLGLTATDTTEDALKGISEPIPIDTSKPGVYSVVFDQKDFMVRNNLLAIKVDTLVERNDNTKTRHYRVEYVSDALSLSGTSPTVVTSLTYPLGGIQAGRVYIINDPGTSFPWGVLGAQSAPGAQGETYGRGVVFLALQNGSDLDLVSGVDYGTPSVWELNGHYYSGTGLARNVPSNLRFNNNVDNSDVTYGGALTIAGTTAEFVYRNTAFAGAANERIKDFAASYGATPVYNLDAQGRPLEYDYRPTAPFYSQNPHDAYSLFIIRVFDGATAGTMVDREAELFGDFALLSIRVNNNDVTPPYVQMYDLNPRTEGVDRAQTQAEALDPQNMGSNRTKGGLFNTGSVASISKSGHIEPRTGTSLTNTQMGGTTTGTINRPSAVTNAYFTVDTVSGEVIVRGYAEDNQRIARVDLEFYNTAATPVRQGEPTTILTRNKTTGVDSVDVEAAHYLLQSAAGERVEWRETVELGRHRVEWAYLWSSEDLPGASLVVGDINVRAVAYNANTLITGTAAGADPVNTIIARNERLHTSALRVRLGNASEATQRTLYDDFNPDYPVSAGNFFRYNDVRVNLRPYITGFLRNSGEFAHNIRSRQGWYILRRGETPVVAGFNLRNGTGNTTISLPGGAGLATRAFTSEAERDNYVVNEEHRALAYNNTLLTTRYRVVSGATTGLSTGDGLVTLSVNGAMAVNTSTTAGERQRAAGTPVRPLAIQPWNVEYSRGVAGSELWDDFTQVHIWQSNETTDMGAVDRARFAKGAFSITFPSMSIDPVTGRLWASHQEGGRKPSQTHGSLYPGGGAYISNNSSTYPYENTDTAAYAGTTEGLRQVASFSEHMTYTSVFVDNSSRVWAANSSITKFNAADRWRFMPGMWLWGPVANYDNQNGSPMISHFPRTTTTLDTTFHWFPFPNTGNGLTGMYAIESLWYNGGTNSRAVASPQSTEQFHNPHIVTNLAGTHVHVSYYDSKDGSLKYRYNEVGTTGVVNSSASPRRWVNLDGGADVDDNSNYNEAQGQAAAGNVPTSSTWIGAYPAEGAVYTNSGQNAINSPYAGGTSYTFAQRNGGTTPTGNLTAVLVQNGSYVTATTPVYTVGATTITAGAAGFIVLNYPTPTNAAIGADSFSTTVSATTTDDFTNDTRRFNITNHGLRVGDVVTVNSTNYYVVWINGTYFKVAPINTPTVAWNVPATTYTVNVDRAAFRIYPVNTTTGRIVTDGRNLASPHNAGRHNAIAVTSNGYPVVAYYDETSQGLKIAVSDSETPTLASNWTIHATNEIFGSNSAYATGTGEYVSIEIDTRTGQDNRFHIAAMNSINKNVVYISGTLGASAGSFAVDKVQIVDSVGNVGNWCKLSLDETGKPWIAYMDANYAGSRDGVKVAFLNETRYYKGGATYAGQDIDLYGTAISGWEAMHVPTRYRVNDDSTREYQLGMERFPTIRNPGATRASGLARFAAVGFLGEDYFRIAYYIE